MKILPNGIAVIEGDSHISHWVEQSGRLDHDQSTLPVILPLIKPGDVVVDAGANIGTHTIAYARAVGPLGRVFAFEPNIRAHVCLWHNMYSYQQFGSHVMVYNSGLSDIPGSRAVIRDINAGATHLASGNPPGADDYAVVVTLDSFELDRLNFFKLDIEGFELLALRGAQQTIARCRPIIMCELNRGALARQGHTPTDVIDYLTRLDTFGYTLRKVFENESLDSEQIDVLFMP